MNDNDIEYFYRNVVVRYFTGHEPTPIQKKAAREYWWYICREAEYIEVYPGIICGYTDTDILKKQLYDASTGMYIEPLDEIAETPYSCELHFIGPSKCLTGERGEV